MAQAHSFEIENHRVAADKECSCCHNAGEDYGHGVCGGFGCILIVLVFMFWFVITIMGAADNKDSRFQVQKLTVNSFNFSSDNTELTASWYVTILITNRSVYSWKYHETCISVAYGGELLSTVNIPNFSQRAERTAKINATVTMEQIKLSPRIIGGMNEEIRKNGGAVEFQVVFSAYRGSFVTEYHGDVWLPPLRVHIPMIQNTTLSV